jgi:hypothetical protein
VSVTGYGRTATGVPVVLDIENPAHLNLNCGNARSFLLFLGLEPGDEPSGEITLPEARRAIIRARATFERRIGGYTRAASDTTRPDRRRVVELGIDEDYFARRLDDFERFVDALVARGATAICWG